MVRAALRIGAGRGVGVSELTDIKDRTPNPDLVRHLRVLLSHAEQGTLRSYAAVLGWDDDSWNHNWVIDQRNTRRRLLGTMSMMQFDMLTNVSLDEGDSVLARALDEQ